MSTSRCPRVAIDEPTAKHLNPSFENTGPDWLWEDNSLGKLIKLSGYPGISPLHLGQLATPLTQVNKAKQGMTVVTAGCLWVIILQRPGAGLDATATGSRGSVFPAATLEGTRIIVYIGYLFQQLKFGSD